MNFSKIVLPVRPQPDTLVAIFILKKFGEARFPGIGAAAIDVWQTIPEGENEESLRSKGILLIDLGGGVFDHHRAGPKTTTSFLAADYLGVRAKPALSKLLEYARRDDFFGKGTMSKDSIDRAFGLSGLVAALNKSLSGEPNKVAEITLPLLQAHYDEEVKRTEEMPAELKRKLESGKAKTFTVRQNEKNLEIIMVDSDNVSLPGFLRSGLGGAFDVVVQRSSAGHVNVLTRPAKKINLKSLAAVLRLEEMRLAGREIRGDIENLSRPGRFEGAPEWYYDPATNSIQNGGVNPQTIPATKIPGDKLRKVLEIGLTAEI